MVGGNGIGDILHQYSLTGLGLCHDECSLSFTDGREQVYDAYAGIRGGLVTAEGELLLGEERGKVLE